MKQLYSYSPVGAPLPGRTYNALEDLNKVVVVEGTPALTGWSTPNSSTSVSNDAVKVTFTTTNTGAVSMSKTFSTTASKHYRLSFNADAATYTNVSVEIVGYGGNALSSATLNTGVTHYQLDFTANDASTVVKVSLSTGTGTRTIYLDNVKLEEVKGDISKYAYNFNGKELDDEGLGGGGSTYDYGFRIYNANLGRFLSVDPLTRDFPWYTPYQFAGNKPIWAIDLDGLEEKLYQSTLKDNWGFKAMLAISDQTTLGKEFNKALKSQNKIDVYYYPLPDKYMMNAGGDIAESRVRITEQGYAVGMPGIPLGTTSANVIYSMEDFEAARLNNSTYSAIDPKQLEQSFKNGKGVIFIGITTGVIDFKGPFNREKLANFRTSGSEVLLHEEWAHALPRIRGITNSMEEEHQAYHGDKTRGSPGSLELMKGQKYHLTNAGKAIKEISKIAKSAYNVKI